MLTPPSLHTQRTTAIRPVLPLAATQPVPLVQTRRGDFTLEALRALETWLHNVGPPIVMVCCISGREAQERLPNLQRMLGQRTEDTEQAATLVLHVDATEIHRVATVLAQTLHAIDNGQRQGNVMDQTPRQPLVEPLRVREIEILHLLAAGRSNQDIADDLCLSVGTVRWHLKNIYGKLGVHSRTQAIVRARSLDVLNDTEINALARDPYADAD